MTPNDGASEARVVAPFAESASMRINDYTAQITGVEFPPAKTRRPGRPRTIPGELEPVVVELYKWGYGYRAISNILREDHRCNPHYSSVRLLLKHLGALADRQEAAPRN